MVSIDPAQAPAQAASATAPNKFYFAAWRWHFYAGLYVIPFFVMLAITGMAMAWIAFIDGRDGEYISVTPKEAPLAVSAQADAALAAIPGGALVQYVAPRAEHLAAIFRVDRDGTATMIAVDPYTAQILAQYPRRSGLYDTMENLHGELMLGMIGDRMIEIAASLGIVLIATGLYMWWPRNSHWRAALVPSLGRGRALWKSLHGVFGFWVCLFLLFFLISGLAWAGIWGGKFVQAWSQFPAEKWDNVPLSDTTHGSMNHGPKEVPWALEQTPMPASGSDAGIAGLPGNTPVTIDTMDGLARQIGFTERYQLNLPTGKSGVWTFSRDSMSTDSVDPTSDRTTHIDQYTGKILADVRYEDCSLAGKAMAVGIALHMGTMGLWSVLANSVVCLSVVLLCVSGVVMWWKRRPLKLARLAAPPMPDNLPLWRGAVFAGLAVSLAFPMAGLTLLTVMLLDAIAISRLPVLKRALS
ncbi:MAG: PepSY domain-containing protein [Hyphomicrobiales bacterium]|nr:PepSY domain-containing protein [Hyphomicrobiales bacterium]